MPKRYSIAELIKMVEEDGWLEKIKAEWNGWVEWEKECDFLVGHIQVLPPYGTQKIFASAAEYFLEGKPSHRPTL